MENAQILEKIENLKGRRAYEEKRAAKLGFSSLYEYFEHKLENKHLRLKRMHRGCCSLKSKEN
mgnify:CR=1 FL=1